VFYRLQAYLHLFFGVGVAKGVEATPTSTPLHLNTPFFLNYTQNYTNEYYFTFSLTDIINKKIVPVILYL